MKICAISDLHGHLPKIDPVDLLIIAGDLCPHRDHSIEYQRNWLDTVFREWLNEVPAKEKVYIFGNHDYIGEYSLLIPDLPCTLLRDSFVTINGLKIYGTPWTRSFTNWAFHLNEEELVKKWQLIPDDVDILVTHSPPYGYGDLTKDSVRIGSPSLTERIKEIQPLAVVCGHVHESQGEYQIEDLSTRILNVAIYNGMFKLLNDPVYVDL